MAQEKTYPGIENDKNGGMTDVGRIIKDAWLFDLLPAEENCTGWSLGQIQQIYDQVDKAWAPYGHLVSQLPIDLQDKFVTINDAAVKHARKQGWNPELGDED